MKNFILGFLAATVIWFATGVYFLYPVYNEWKKWERAKVEMIEKTKNTQEATKAKIQSWKAKFTKSKE